VPVSLVPIYIRAGAVIPHRELEQFVGQVNPNPLTFDVYPGPDRRHNVYLDDKVSMQAQTNGVCRLTEVSQSLRSGAFKIQSVRVLRTYDHFKPDELYYFVAMLRTPLPISVAVNGKVLTRIQAAADSESADQLTASAVNAYYYNTSLQTTFVKVFDAAPGTRESSVHSRTEAPAPVFALWTTIFSEPAVSQEILKRDSVCMHLVRVALKCGSTRSRRAPGRS
jgi:alpha-glucosidase